MMSGNSGSKPGAIPGSPPPALEASQQPDGGSLKTVVAQAPATSVRTRGVFTVTSGSDIGMVISLPAGSVITLGRSDDCVVRFEDASLSRVHARVMRIGGEYVLDDAGSTNGSYINEQRLQKPAPLHDGDRVQLGSATTLRFSLVDEAEEAALKKIYEQAVRDGLTGVSNRKHLEERLDAEIAFAARHNAHLSIVMMDIDFFKKVNDTYGHLGGDAVLRNIGGLLARAIRTEDLVARYGGEEFVIVARGIDGANTTVFAERLRQSIERTPVLFEGQQLYVTSSAGVASLVDCGERRDKATLLGLADGRLYQAKQGGRNRVVGAG
jgi:two-component system, cell cycle response regulator